MFIFSESFGYLRIGKLPIFSYFTQLCKLIISCNVSTFFKSVPASVLLQFLIPVFCSAYQLLSTYRGLTFELRTLYFLVISNGTLSLHTFGNANFYNFGCESAYFSSLKIEERMQEVHHWILGSVSFRDTK